MTSHYLKQSWPDSLMYICGTKGRWLNTLMPGQNWWFFSNAFNWIKTTILSLKFHWGFFPRINLLISHHWVQVMACCQIGNNDYLNQCWPTLLTIYALPDFNELDIHMILVCIGYIMSSLWILLICLPIFRRVASLSLGKSLYHMGTNEIILKNMG